MTRPKTPTKHSFTPEFLAMSREDQKAELLRRGEENIMNLKGLINEAFRVNDQSEVAICRALLATAERIQRELKEG